MRIALRNVALLLLVLIASTLGSTSHAADSAKPSFVGTWQGTLEAGPMKLRIVFDIKAAEAGLTGTMDSPDQRAFGLKLDSVKQEGTNVTAELRMINGSYNGTFSADGSEIVGTWSQSGQSLPLTLRRGEKIVPSKRPQEPVAPVPYQAEDLTYDNAGIRLAGTLDMQTPPRQSFPAVEAATANTGLPAEYSMIEETVSPAVLTLVSDWVTQHTSAKPHG
jgi:hypothetical protein